MSRPNIVIFASGTGSTFEYLVLKAESGELNANISLLIVDRENVGAITLAEGLRIPYVILLPKDCSSTEEWGEQLIDIVSKESPSVIVLAGFLRKMPANFVKFYKNKIINSHPALLPKFGGKGMYGQRVHQAVIEAGDSKSGVTIHFVDEHFDEGPILAQKEIAISVGETASSLEEKIKAIEKPFLLSALKIYLNSQGTD